MREIIAVCRSQKQSRDRVARVLDRYFWRIGDRTWRGKATNACLDRVSRELRKRATRNTAVVIHEIRSSAESRKPLIRIGSRLAFSDEGVVPVASHPADFKRRAGSSDAVRAGVAAVAISALFHDLGKATNLFQKKLLRALNGGAPEADAVRHELFSAAVWDRLFGEIADAELPFAIQILSPETVDQACRDVRATLKEIHSSDKQAIGFSFVSRPGSLAHLIGMLILTHHRLPEGESSYVVLQAERHVRRASTLDRDVDLAIAPGTPFWHENWWLAALRMEASHLRAGAVQSSADIALRASLMFADHLGSAKAAAHDIPAAHLANTTREEGWQRPRPGDSLSRHVKRVYHYSRFAHEMTHALRDRYPALDQTTLPDDIACPQPSSNIRFGWQAEAALAVRRICEQREGGFFAAILAGTGTGKTRGAPTILASAAMADKRQERRYLRLSLCLGLRVLASQSAREYVDDLEFRREDVSVLIGDPPLEFRENADERDPQGAEAGSESLINLPEWLRVEHINGAVPQEGSAEEENWLRALSLDTDRGLPAFLDMVIEAAGSRARDGRRLVQAPVMVGTIDHLMGVAAPVNSRFLLQSLRLLTSDLILDEIDQYDGEDLAAIGRLVFQAGAAGRRVIIMSATLTPDIAQAMYQAYSRGWADHARGAGVAQEVNLLVCGDAPGSIFTNGGEETLDILLTRCSEAILAALRSSPPLRRGEILPPCESWQELVRQIDDGCSRLHGTNAVAIDGFDVSVGLIRMTRIAHAAALAMQMRSGHMNDRLRLLVCLHARMPRLHRSYIESRLKRALTRKGGDPEAGVRALCEAEGVFGRARDAGVRHIEIVVVASPVIETGNDLDFDYAIIDPISTRAIVQTAGRVRRHRAAGARHVNVLIMGRSPVAMQEGRLRRPGVETEPAGETEESRISLLEAYPGRNFADLAGEADFSTVSAAPLLVPQANLRFPLKEAETRLRVQMISTGEHHPLGKYLAEANARWNLKMTKTRRFRRSETREALFCKIGDSLGDARWYLDLAPGTRNSAPREAGQTLCLSCDMSSVSLLFTDLTEKAWIAISGGQREMERVEMKTYFQVPVPIYGDDLTIQMTYTEFTGFTRGKAKDLFEAFGKSN